MPFLFYALFMGFTLLSGCNSSEISLPNAENIQVEIPAENVFAKKHFRGAISNGMKGDSLSFDISADGKKLENLTFKGYWRCAGRQERTTVGPDGAITIVGNKVNEHISEPPNGGSTAWRFKLVADIKGNTAAGTFRMNINNLGCDSYELKWTAKATTK